LTAEIDRLSGVLDELKAHAANGDGLEPLDEARLLVALDQSTRKLSKLAAPPRADGKRRRR
jgi:hypothetical protein